MGHLAQGLDLARTAIPRIADFGHAVYDERNFLAELSGKFGFDPVERFTLILDGVMQQAGDGPGFIADQFIDVTGDPDAVGLEIRITVVTQLPAV